MARRVAAYSARGSAAPLEGKCGAKLRQPPDFVGVAYRHCTKDALKGSTRCKAHGGASLVGPASATYKTGEYSLLFEPDGPLYRGYMAAQSDSDLLSLREQLKLARAREQDLVEQVAAAAKGGSSWPQVQRAVRALTEIMAAPKPDAAAFTAALERLRSLVEAGRSYEDLWRQWAEHTELHRKLKETEARLVERGQMTVPVEQAVAYGARIANMAVEVMGGDKKMLQKFAQSLRALTAGRQVEDAGAVEVGGPR